LNNNNHTLLLDPRSIAAVLVYNEQTMKKKKTMMMMWGLLSCTIFISLYSILLVGSLSISIGSKPERRLPTQQEKQRRQVIQYQHDASNQVDHDIVHAIFSTDCSPYQDWQSLVLFHSAKIVGQRGSVVRIASGCDEEKQQELTELYKKLFPESSFCVIFAPDFSFDAKKRKCKEYFTQ
jgi:hypothetical protein